MKSLVFLVMIWVPLLVSAELIPDSESMSEEYLNGYQRSFELERELYTLQSHCRGCTDQGSTLFDSQGNSICGLIGVAGQWDETCADKYR